MIPRHAFFNEIALGALHAPFGEFHVVVLGTSNVRVALENQVSVRFVLQILLEVARQCIERRSLAWGQATTGLRHRRLRRREVNAVQCQLGFQLLDLRWLLHVHIAGSISAGAAAVIHGALHAVAPRLETCRIKLHIGAAAYDLSARRRVAVGQRIVVRVAAVASDAGMLARQNGAALDGECGRRRMIGLFIHFDVRGARRRPALTVIHLYAHGVGASSHAGRIPARLRTRAFYRAAGRRVAVR